MAFNVSDYIEKCGGLQNRRGLFGKDAKNDPSVILILANSLVEWTSVFETFFFVVGKFSNFYTVKYGKVQYSIGI